MSYINESINRMFSSGIEELDFKVNRERQQTLIIKRRMFNASDGRARSNATEGKAMAPSMTKYTYWTPKVKIILY